MSHSTLKRPVGISILSCLSIIGGLLTAVLWTILIITPTISKRLWLGLSVLGIPPFVLIIGVAFLCTLSVLAGFGMRKGRKWGWYLGSFASLYNVLRNISALLLVPTILDSISPEENTQMTRDPSYYYVKYGIRAIISLLIYFYFFKENVRAYFGLSKQKKWKPIFIQVSICLCIDVVFSFLREVLN